MHRVKRTQCFRHEVSPPSASCARGVPPLCVRLLKETSRSGECPLQKPCASCRSCGRDRKKDDPSVYKLTYLIVLKKMSDKAGFVFMDILICVL